MFRAVSKGGLNEIILLEQSPNNNTYYMIGLCLLMTGNEVVNNIVPERSVTGWVLRMPNRIFVDHTLFETVINSYVPVQIISYDVPEILSVDHFHCFEAT